MTTRKLANGNWRTEFMYDGRRYSKTLPSAAAVEAWRNKTRNDLVQGTYLDTSSNGQAVGDYGRTWIDQRELKTNVRIDHLNTWQRYIEPTFGKTKIRNVTPQMVRTWRSELPKQIKAGNTSERVTGEAAAAKAYRLLNAVMATAVDENLLLKNPCKVKGGSAGKIQQRQPLPLLAAPTVAAEVLPRYQAYFWLLALSGLRPGEAAALRRSDLDLNPERPRVTVSRRVYKLPNGVWDYDTPKTKAGQRSVDLIPELVPIIQAHLDSYAAPGIDGLVFTSSAGNPALEAGSRAIKKALQKCGYADLVPYCLRHTAATEATAAGVPLQDLKHLLGHSTTTAALIYQHSTSASQQVATRRLGERVAEIIPFKKVANG